MLITNITALGLGFFGTLAIAPLFLKLLYKSNCLATNFKNVSIPIGMGIVLLFLQTLIITFLSIIMNIQNSIYLLTYNIGLLLVGLTGFLDDVIGNTSVKGVYGHFTSLIEGELTTGSIKAVITIICSFILSYLFSNSITQFFFNAVIISLFTNFINLFDLRPGRATKVFFFISIIMLFTSINGQFHYFLYSITGIALAYFPMDMKGKCMMGDVGSNVLGFTLGVFCVLTQSTLIKLFYFTFLVFVHIITEFYSIT
ncbi:hypothetical protein, partial [Caldisalinibacter kiritimatiensis]|uniref:hypothetical protein n=1 Tax=Caldisalinibacter kiritimatiensis TaxID=1304284 RepID=UPI000552E78A